MPSDTRTTERADLEIRLRSTEPPPQAFRLFVEQCLYALRGSPISIELRPGGTLAEGGVPFGRVLAYDPGRELVVRFRSAPWRESPEAELRAGADLDGSGSVVRVELVGWNAVLRAHRTSVAEWAGAALAPRLWSLLAPRSHGDWVVDQQARRPSGPQSAGTYRDPTFHWPNFLLLLERLALGPEDRLLEVGSGGGAFLSKALERGCTAVGVDHSPEMLRTAADLNVESVRAGRLRLLEGDAARLPVADDAFTVCVCTGAFFFFPDPRAALREMARALAPGGRLALFTETPKAAGTIAAPEPFASRAHLYTPEQLKRLASDAGFESVRVELPDLQPYARAAGLSSEVVEAFRGTDVSVLLTARKPSARPAHSAGRGTKRAPVRPRRSRGRSGAGATVGAPSGTYSRTPS